MNSLLGNSLPGPSGLGAMSGTVGWTDQMKTVYAVGTGELGSQLEDQKELLRSQGKQIEKQKKQIASLESGSGKARAAELFRASQRAYKDGVRELRKAADEHNKIAAKLDFYTAGIVNPNTVNLGQVDPVSGGVGLTVAVVAAVAILVSGTALALAFSWNTIMSTNSKRGSLIAQTGDAINDAFRGAGDAADKGGKAVVRIAWAFAGVLGVYVGYQLIQDRRRGRRAPRRAALPSPVAQVLKPVQGSVV